MADVTVTPAGGRSIAAAAERNKPLPEEIRFAVVLNGGVSLAVWMAGVIRELDNLTRNLGPYGCLLEKIECTARADVISGTSAGGINGAALAIAQANKDADLGELRELWAEQGRMDALLREPFKGAPASLLKGDDYFLPELRKAFSRLCSPFTPTDPDEHPIDLTITTTLLNGARRTTVDGLGQVLAQRVHDGKFQFRRDPSDRPDDRKERQDDFSEETIAETARRLALAARATAGFPFAFEPCFIPARQGDDDSGAHDDSRPDMYETVSWKESDPTLQQGTDRSRFGIDGGLLANTPTTAALKAVSRMPASDTVRRVMLLIYPHASPTVADAPDRPEDAPTVVATLDGILSALLSQGSRTFVEEIETHNKTARMRRASRSDVLAMIEGDPARLYDLAFDLHPHYCNLRLQRAARDLAATTPARPNWSAERIRAAAEDAQREWLRKGKGLPYVPPQGSLPIPPLSKLGNGWAWGTTTALGLIETALDLIKRLSPIVPVLREDDQDLPDLCKPLFKARTELFRQRHEVDDIWTTDADIARLAPDRAYWNFRLAAYQNWMLSWTGDMGECRKAVLDGYDEARAEAGVKKDSDPYRAKVKAAIDKVADEKETRSVGTIVRDQAVAVARHVSTILEKLNRPSADLARAAEVEHWYTFLTSARLPYEPLNPGLLILSRLLALDVVNQTLGDEDPTGEAFPIELVQLSLQTQSPFMTYTRTADDKVGGLAIARFAGFLKRSWRVNDWTWGRLDAATMLCRILLKPDRIYRNANTQRWLGAGPDDPAEAAGNFVKDLVFGVYGTDEPDVPDFADTRDDAVKELTPIFDPATTPSELPPTLTHLATLVAWALQASIAAEELPAIARAVRADRLDGSNPRSRGQLFLEEYDSLLERLDRLPPRDAVDADREPGRAERLRLGLKALDAVDRAGIGRESLAEEGTSDQLIRTVTTVTGVAVTVAAGEGSGLAPIRPITSVLRGAALLPFWTITGLTRGGSIARFLSLLALVGGGLLVVLAMFGALPVWAAGPGAAVGIGALLAAFGYGALRTSSLLHGVVLLSPLLPLVVYAYTAVKPTEDAERTVSTTEGVSVVVIVGCVIAGLLLLGSLPAPLQSPAAAFGTMLDRCADRFHLPHARRGDRSQLRVRRAVSGALAAAVTVGVVALVVYAIRWIDVIVDAVTWVLGWPGDHRWPSSAIAGAVVLAAVGMAWIAGRGFQLLLIPKENDRVSIRRVRHPAGTTAGWAVVYGFAYLVAAGALIYFAADELDQWWARTALATAAVFAAYLLLVLPWMIPLRARRGETRRLVDTADPPAYECGTGETPLPSREYVAGKLVNVLIARAVTFRYLVGTTKVLDTPRAGTKKRALVCRYTLTRRGRRLAGRIQVRLLIQLGVPSWLAKSDLSRVVTRTPAVVTDVDGAWTRNRWISQYRELLLWSDGLEVGSIVVHGSGGRKLTDSDTELEIGRDGDRTYFVCARRGTVRSSADGDDRRRREARDVRAWMRKRIRLSVAPKPGGMVPPDSATEVPEDDAPQAPQEDVDARANA